MYKLEGLALCGKVCSSVLLALLVGLLISVKPAQAQDIHFSQFYFSPLTVNPAQTGFFNGRYRFAANYRDQWGFVPFLKTYAASFDAKLVNNLFSYGNILALGVYMYGDNPEPGHIGRTGFFGSAAYHQTLGDKNHYIAVGVQGGLHQIGFDPNLLRFGDQIVNGSTSSNEAFNSTNIQFTDIGAGALWNIVPNERANIYAGFSLFHLNSPVVNFASGPANTLSMRTVIHGGAAIKLNDQFDLLPAIMLMKQRSASELIMGAALRYNLEDNAGIRFGSWFRNYRNADALVIMTALDYQRFIFGLSYDFNISSFSRVSNARGGYEISLIYTGGVIVESKRNRNKGRIPCPIL